MLCRVLDEVWALVRDEYDGDAQAVEAARLELATVIIGLARDHQLDSLQIAQTAMRIMRERTGQSVGGAPGNVGGSLPRRYPV